MKLAEAGEFAYGVRQCSQRVVGRPEFDQTRQLGDAVGEEREGVVADVEIAESGELCEGGRQGCQAVVVKVKEVGQTVEITKGVREMRELIVAEVEGAEVLEVADFDGDFGEVVVGEDECLNVELVPHILGY